MKLTDMYLFHSKNSFNGFIRVSFIISYFFYL